MATQRAIAAHLILSVPRIQQLQYAGVIEKDASLDSARLSYLRWLRERISSKSNSDINNERARLVYHQVTLVVLNATNHFTLTPMFLHYANNSQLKHTNRKVSVMTVVI
jgi:hypothetical protein